ncbi:acetamidase/formamidase family protein [Kribbella hippodromi]|uniref:Acetamidase/formamidase family protein n=1 Tax=Kribbella hippodromi TaxID=434347 RepID=A0ABN2D8W2_9ACTN
MTTVGAASGIGADRGAGAVGGVGGPAVVRVPRGAHGFAFDRAATPVVRVPPGSSLVVETYDCFSNKVSSSEQVFGHESELLDLIGQYNPVTGPIYVESAEPGDRLVVHIDHIDLGTFAPYATTLVTGDSKGVCGGHWNPLDDGLPDTRICALDGDTVTFPAGAGDLRLPVRPMIGSIGTASATGGASSLEFGPLHGGNVDCPSITTGATVLLPVNVPGALLFLGDVHAAMGDAEVTGTALETNGDVHITVDVVKGGDEPVTPRLDTATTLGSIGCEFGAPLERNLRHAFTDLIERLHRGHRLTRVEAYELLGATARVQVNQCVAGGWTAVHVNIARSVVPDPEKTDEGAG